MTTLCPHCGSTVYVVPSKISDKTFLYGTEPSPVGDVVVDNGTPRWAERRDAALPRLRRHTCAGLFDLGGDAA